MEEESHDRDGGSGDRDDSFGDRTESGSAVAKSGKMAELFKRWKNELKATYVDKGKTPKFTGRFEKIRDHWPAFVANKTLERSKKMKTNARRSKQPRPAPSTGQGPILQGEASRPGPQQAPVGAPWQIGEAQVAGPGSPPSPWTAAPSLSRRAAADPSELRRIASAKRGGDNAPVSQRRLERSMTGAARALRGLQFLDQSVVTQGSWPEVEKRFDRLAVDGLLLRSRFSKCIGMVGSEEFAAQMVDALTQRRGIVAQVLTKDELREFWEQLSDSGSWLSQFVSTRSGSGSISQITLSSVCFNAFRFREYITDNIRFSLFQHKSSCLCQVLICQVVVLSRSNFCGQMFRDQMILDLLLIIGS
nr:respiratory burst oxidase homolog protein C [Aegilops tauschii subsp. strangulata]